MSPSSPAEFPADGDGPPEVPEHEPEEVTERDAQWLGRYRLCFELAAGGMATVYLARAEGPAGFEKLVALKRIHRHLAKSARFVDMFLDEARIASRIDHPNVCSVFDFGEADGSYFLAMEYLMGEPLSAVLRATWRTGAVQDPRRLASLAARVVIDVCEGLHAAHELADGSGASLHIVHRDVSPQNLFVTYDGVVKVVDFGIASARHRLHQTVTGEVKGKFAYMPPEQLRGAEVDRRADVWSLGVVLWEACTLRRLFRRPTEMETIEAVNHAPIAAPSQVRPGVPRPLDAIVRRALERDPDRRYATARELGRDLLEFTSKHGVPTGPADVAEWLEEAFPGKRDRKRQLVEIAHSRADVPRLHGRPSPDSSWGDDGAQPGVAPRPNRPGGARVARVAGLTLAAVAVMGIGLAIGLRSGSGDAEPTGDAEGAGAPQAPEAAAPSGPAAHDDDAAAPGRPEFPVSEQRAAAPDAQHLDEQQPEQSNAERLRDKRRRQRAARRRRRQAAQQAEATRQTEGTAQAEATGQTEAAQEASGRVNVVTPGGWASIHFDGRRLGQTPQVISLPAGRHRLELRPFGQAPHRHITVDVAAGETAKVSVPLSR